VVIPATADAIVEQKPKQRSGPVQRLRRLTENIGLLRTSDGGVYAHCRVRGRGETYPIRSKAFRQFLLAAYLKLYQEIPSDWAMRRVVDAVEAVARIEGDTPSVFHRVGHDGESSRKYSNWYLDLGDPGGHVVKIGPDGWSVVANPGIHFRRPPGYSQLPFPIGGGSIDLLRPYVNAIERDFRLLLIWLAATLRPTGNYPVLALYGHTGTAKTTLARIVRQLIDPRDGFFPGQPRNTRELMISAVNGWLLGYDNLGVLSHSLSDSFCLMATGGAFVAGATSTSDEQTMIHTQRPVVLTGIDEFVQRSDLADRSVFLHLPTIPPHNRRCEEEFWDAFHQDSPRILGALLDAVARGLHELPSVRRPSVPRMADFARFAVAVGRGFGWPDEETYTDYIESRKEATVPQIEDSLVAAVLEEFLNIHGEWRGYPGDLLDLLTMQAGKKMASSPRWPKSPARLSYELRRLAPELAEHRIIVNLYRKAYGRQVYVARDLGPDPESVDVRNHLVEA
jgi:hypothetical protein